jgi:hypothetical protein
MPPTLPTAPTPPPAKIVAQPLIQPLTNGFTFEESQSPVESLRKRAHAAADAGDGLLLELWQKFGDVQQTLAAYRAAGRTALPALPVARDAKVIAHRALRFQDDGGSFFLMPWAQQQTVPERFLSHPYFQSAVKSGWVEVISEPAVPSQEVTRG